MKRKSFRGTVKVEWLPDGRKMKLLGTVYYVDSNGATWVAHRNDVVDGASIPRFFWRLIGSPFVGKFRRASVIHDVYCDSKSRPAQDVHDVFKEMMEVDGVGKVKRNMMYQAVNNFGPRW